MHSTGATPYLYKKPLAPWARIKLTMTRADCRVVIAMANLHPCPCSCRETRPQGSTGGSPPGEGRSVKKICLWHIFSVGRSGYAASKPWFLWRIVRGGRGGEGNRNPSPLKRRFAILEPIYDPAAAVINGRGGARELAQFSSLRRKRSLAHFATTSRRGQRRSLRRAKYPRAACGRLRAAEDIGPYRRLSAP